jgi:hypothetical protein
MPNNRRRATPTFAQTVRLIQTMPTADQQDREAIKRRHLALGFTYQTNQIDRAIRALTDPARAWSTRRRSDRST